MANDNILAGIGGFLEGTRDVLVPYLNEKYKFDRESALLRQKSAADSASKMGLKQFESDLELQRKRTLMPEELASQIELERAKAGMKQSKRVLLRSEVLAMTPEQRAGIDENIQIVDDSPTATEAKASGKEEAKSRFSGNLVELNEIIDNLNNMGAMVSVGSGDMRNVSAYVRASGIGQAIGSARGTPEATERQRLEQLRPVLLNDIRKASEQGARGLDTERELDFYLQAVPSTQKSYQANIDGLRILEQAYGSGQNPFLLPSDQKPWLKGMSSGGKGSPVTPFSQSAQSQAKPSNGGSGLSPEQRRARIAELRRMKGE